MSTDLPRAEPAFSRESMIAELVDDAFELDGSSDSEALQRELEQLAPELLAVRFRVYLNRRVTEQTVELILSEPDVGLWRVMSYWRPEEAVALLLGGDPRWLRSAIVDELIEHTGILDDDGSCLLERYVWLLDALRRAQEIGDLPEKLRPRAVLSWAKLQRLRIPATIECFDGSARENANGDETLLDREVESEDLHPRVRRTLYTLVLGMARDKYGYVPGEAGSDTVAKIIDGLANAGLEISDKTVRARLDEGRKLLDEKKGKRL